MSTMYPYLDEPVDYGPFSNEPPPSNEPEPFVITFRCPRCAETKQVTITWGGQEVYCCGSRLTGSDTA